MCKLAMTNCVNVVESHGTTDSIGNKQKSVQYDPFVIFIVAR